MTILTKFNFGDSVFLLHDPEMMMFVITGITILPPKTVLYHITCGLNLIEAYEFELADYSTKFAN